MAPCFAWTKVLRANLEQPGRSSSCQGSAAGGELLSQTVSGALAQEEAMPHPGSRAISFLWKALGHLP